MADFLPVGTRLEYFAEWPSNVLGLDDADTVAADIRGPLQTEWGILVLDSLPESPVFYGPEKLRLTLRLDNAYGKADDVRAVIDGEIIKMGVALRASRVFSVQRPGKPPESTGEPPPPAKGNGAGGADKDECGWLAKQLGLCEGLDVSTILILGGVAIVTVIIIGTFLSPATPARVAASFREGA